MSVENCQGCAYLNPVMWHCGKYLRGCETAIYLCQKAKPQTNADRIRAMTDEELANLLAHKVDACHNCSTDSVDTCIDCWLEWLKQEAQCTSA